MTNTVGARERRQIEAPLELVRLNADDREQRRIAGTPEKIEITKVRLNVFVDRMCLDVHTVDRGRRHAPNVRNGAVRHEAAAETFDVTAQSVLAGFDYDDAKHRVMINRSSRCVKLRDSASVDLLSKEPREAQERQRAARKNTDAA